MAEKFKGFLSHNGSCIEVAMCHEDIEWACNHKLMRPVPPDKLGYHSDKLQWDATMSYTFDGLDANFGLYLDYRG